MSSPRLPIDTNIYLRVLYMLSFRRQKNKSLFSHAFHRAGLSDDEMQRAIVSHVSSLLSDLPAALAVLPSLFPCPSLQRVMRSKHVHNDDHLLIMRRKKRGGCPH